MFIIDNNEIRISRQNFNSLKEAEQFIKKEQEEYEKEGGNKKSKDNINPFNWKVVSK